MKVQALKLLLNLGTKTPLYHSDQWSRVLKFMSKQYLITRVGERYKLTWWGDYVLRSCKDTYTYAQLFDLVYMYQKNTSLYQEGESALKKFKKLGFVRKIKKLPYYSYYGLTKNGREFVKELLNTFERYL